MGSRDAGRGQRAAEEIGGDTRPLVLDVTGADSIREAAALMDRPDVLVNNTGVSPGPGAVVAPGGRVTSCPSRPVDRSGVRRVGLGR
ncbi:hypothetical protein GCM10023083_28940 [Streptomyces phyllanthi]